MSPAPTDVTARIRATLPGMSPAEARICQILEANPAGAAALTVNDLAALASSSTATVVRAARRLGFDGYPQLRLALAAQGGAGHPGDGVPLDAEIEEGDAAGVIVAKLAAFESEQIRATAELVDPATLDKVVGLIRWARGIDVYGIGASGLVAQDLAAKLSRAGLDAHAHTEHDPAVVSACLLSRRPRRGNLPFG
jgi:DNA-binding MurR/RpiR family transcriptional regulator